MVAQCPALLLETLKKNPHCANQRYRGMTVLERAAEHRWEEVIAWLLKFGSNSYVNSRTALVRSLGGYLRTNPQICRMLLETGSRATLNIAWQAQGTPLHLAVYAGSPDIVMMLLNAGADPDRDVSIYGDAMQVAALTGREDILRLLLEKGAKPDKVHGEMGSAYLAAVAGHDESHARIAALLKTLSLEPSEDGFL
jgi:ankyrin repeat protein